MRHLRPWRTALLTLLLAAGCGTALDPMTDAPGTLVVHTKLSAGTSGATDYAWAVTEFERENPGARIKTLYSSDDIFNVYETARLAGKEADVVLVNLYDKAWAWTSNGATVPVGDYLRDWGLTGRVAPDALHEWTDSQGRLRGFPWQGFTWPVLFNRDLLARAGVAGVPTTVDGLLTAAARLRGLGITPMAIGGNDWSGEKLLLQIAQAYLAPADAQRVYSGGGFCASPAAVRGLELFTRLRDSGLFGPGAEGFTADQMNASYFSGRAAMMPAITSTIAKVPGNVGAHTAISGFPSPPGGTFPKPTVYTGATSTGIWLSPNGVKKLPLAEKFVKFLYRPDVVQRFIDSSGYTMNFLGQAPSAQHPLVTASDRISSGDSVNRAVMPDSLVPAAVSAPLVRATSLAYHPGTPAGDLCAALDTAYHS